MVSAISFETRTTTVPSELGEADDKVSREAMNGMTVEDEEEDDEEEDEEDDDHVGSACESDRVVDAVEVDDEEGTG